VGYLDPFAKDTFARETAIVMGRAVAWQLPPEVGLTEVRLDGLLRVNDPAPLAASELGRHMCSCRWHAPRSRHHSEARQSASFPATHTCRSNSAANG
jgi:hypothetical protein